MGMHFTNLYYGRKIDQAVSEWLYSDWNESKQKKFEYLYAIPGVHEYLDYMLDKRADQEYFDRYGMSYSDVHDPRKLRQTSSGSSAVHSGYRMISSNVNKLYHSARRPTYKKKKRR